ncbi:MAG: ABC transporter permease, partial [Desulfovibrionales bacterium]
MKPHTGRMAEISSGNGRVELTGRLNSRGVAQVWRSAVDVATDKGELVIDASGVEYLDGAGAALIARMEEVRVRSGGFVKIQGLPDEYVPLLEMYREENRRRPEPEQPHRFSFLEQVGRKGMMVGGNFLDLVAFLGESTASLCRCISSPRRVRWKEVFSIAETAGINALPIILLIGFLMGLVLAFQSSIPLRMFGAEIFIADMLGLTMFREMGPLTTAILLAGRSGSAFAAEIGTMKINDEINALRTMGVSPVQFLAVPRIIAAIVIAPILNIFFILLSFIGGAVVFLSLGYPMVTYVNRIGSVVSL